jgi:hypothetical protein
MLLLDDKIMAWQLDLALYPSDTNALPRLCPLLNGEMAPDQNDFNNAAFASPTAAMSSFMSPPSGTPTGAVPDMNGF